MKVLVAYGTKYGSTTQVAEEIASVQRGKGNTVDVLDLRTDGKNDLRSYDLIVLGSGIQAGAWTKEAQRFLDDNRKVLSQSKVAMFVCCGDVVFQGKSIEDSHRKYLEDVASRFSLSPKSVALFGGVLDYSRYGFLVKSLLNGAKKDFEKRGIDMSKPYDFRDWKQIRAWAGDLV